MNQRVQISKKQRFEIFKRDGFVCQYCGSHPPKVVLEVDHIIAVANGGDNDEDNLITSCFDCNRGKSSNPLSVVPKSLRQKAEETAERELQIAGYSAILEARRSRIESEVWLIVDAMYDTNTTTHQRFRSIKIFIERLGLHEVLDAVEIAQAKYGYDCEPQWKYFCGTCWGKIKDMDL